MFRFFRRADQPVPQGHHGFNKFTRRARHVLALAQEEARRLDHDYLGTEHLLLGLLREPEGIAGRVLAGLGVELATTRSAVERIVGRGAPPVAGAIRLTPRTKRVIGLAVEEAGRLHHRYLGTEHLLLGLLAEGEGVGARILRDQGLTPAQVRQAVLAILQAGPSPHA